MVKVVDRISKNVKIRDQVSIVNGVLGQLKVLLLRNGSVKFLWSSSTPENVLKEGLSRTISTIPGADFSREGEKWSSSAAQHGIFRNFKNLAAVAKYYGAGRPLNAGACGARIIMGYRNF